MQGWDLGRYRTAAWVAAIVGLFAVSFLLLVWEPGSRQAAPADDPAPSAPVTTETVAGQPNTVKCGSSTAPTARLTEISTGRHEDFDRVVLRLDGPAAPECSAEFVDQLTADGSGAPITLPGNAFLSVGLFHATTVDDDGEPVYSGPSRIDTPHLANVVAVTLTGDFEGYLHVGIGMDEKTSYQVFSLEGPTRVVVDVAH